MSTGPAMRLELRQDTHITHQRHCIHCMGLIQEPRLKRGSVTCSKECFRLDKIERRRYLRQFRCKDCGSALPKSKRLKLDAVRQAQPATEEVTQ